MTLNWPISAPDVIQEQPHWPGSSQMPQHQNRVNGNQYPIVSELLMFAQNHVISMPANVLKEILREFYSSDEIAQAKMLLWDNRDGWLGKIINRKKSSKRTKMDAEITDILQGMRKLDEVENKPKFVAADYKRLPNEIDIVSIVERLDLENVVKEQDGRITKNAEDVTKITMKITMKVTMENVPNEPNRRRKPAERNVAQRNEQLATVSREAAPQPAEPRATDSGGM